MYGIHLIVQSSHKGPAYLNDRIESFLRVYRDTLVSMDDATFRHNVEAVIENLTEKPKSLDKEANRHLDELRAGFYLYGRKQLLAKILSDTTTVTPARMLAFFDLYFLNTENRKKFSCQFSGSGSTSVEAQQTAVSVEGVTAVELESVDVSDTAGTADATAKTAPTTAVEVDQPAVVSSDRDVVYVTDHALFKKSMPLLCLSHCVV